MGREGLVGFCGGLLQAEVSVDSLKTLFGFLGDRLGINRSRLKQGLPIVYFSGDRSIEAFFRDQTSDDLVWLYFSGHCIADAEDNFFFSATKTSKDKGKLVKSSAVAARNVYDHMGNCESDRQVVILDCCHSGAFGD